ncbi:MAG: L-threonylcarbamoyladenylate synthase [Succinivibrionaceae bacterium]
MALFITIHPENPQSRLIAQAVDVLKKGGVMVYPTDSGYALGCMLDNKAGFQRICHIRDVNKKHNFTLVCPNISEISRYASVDNTQFRLIKRYTPGPYTFILRASKEVPHRVMNEKRRTIGLRIPDFPICTDLLKELGEPIMSTTLILPGSEVAENDPYNIREILDSQVDVIVDGGYISEKPTTVVDMAEDEIEIIRVGQGDPAPFC